MIKLKIDDDSALGSLLNTSAGVLDDNVENVALWLLYSAAVELAVDMPGYRLTSDLVREAHCHLTTWAYSLVAQFTADTTQA